MAITTTVQNIVDATERDVQRVLGAQHPALLDYANRIHLWVLKASRWQFLLSPLKRFITQEEQTDYWLGVSGSNTAGTVDTGLNLTDLDVIKRGTVVDRSNFRALLKVNEAPLIVTLAERDATSKAARPALWRHDPDTPDVMSIYPAPDNENNFKPNPQTPILQVFGSGVLANRTYFVKVTFVDTEGNESVASEPAAERFITSGDVIVVRAPQPGITTNAVGVKYDRFNVYASTTKDSEQLQNASPIPITSNFQEPDSGLISGAAFPTVNNLSELGGYIIEFRYFEDLKQMTLLTDIFQVPDRYKDVLIAGVNWLAFQYLGNRPESQDWRDAFLVGIQQMIHNKHLFPRGGDFVRPDSSTLGNLLPSVESFDFSLLPES